MAGEDFVILPNGKKIYIKDLYGKVDIDKFPKKNRIANLFYAFNTNYDRNLNSNEIKNIFDSIKSFAAKDGNNELSTAELMGFVKENIKDEYDASLITQKEVMKFLEIIQKESDRKLELGTKGNITNSLNEVFPELSFMDLGSDNDVNVSKFSFDEIKKHYPSDKYEVREEYKIEYYAENKKEHSITRSDSEFPGSKRRELITKYIVNKETGKTVVSGENKRDNSYAIEIINEESGDTTEIRLWNDEKESISVMRDDFKYIAWIEKEKVIAIKNDKVHLEFDDDGFLYSKATDSEEIFYENGIEIRREKLDTNSQTVKNEPVIHTNISETIESLINSNNISELSELIYKSVQSKEIGADMDDYYNRTGRELIDDIQKSDIPNDIKEKLLNDICKPYIDSKYYDAHKKVENSKVENEYYTSTDEYSIEFNGPIINVLNKTTGKKSRINLQTLLKDLDYRSNKWLKRSLQTIQSFSGEVLENLSIEVARIATLTREEAAAAFNGKGHAGGAYMEDEIVMPSLKKEYVVVHELGHAIDDIGDDGFLSSKSKFKQVYDECIKRYEESGHKRFDDYHPMKSVPILPVNKGVNYATYNEHEAFAICMEILMGQKINSNSKFVKKVMPELIDAARELYLEIRNKTQEERRKIKE